MPLRALRPLRANRRNMDNAAFQVEKDIMPLRALRRSLMRGSILYRFPLWRKTSCPCGHCDKYDSKSRAYTYPCGERHHALAGIATGEWDMAIPLHMNCGERHHALAGIATRVPNN